MGNKKVISLLLIILLLVITVGCTNGNSDGEGTTTTTTELTEAPTTTEDPLLKDIYPPFMKIDAAEVNVRIRQGESFDLLRGISGLDNLEGDITHKIQMNTGNYNPNVPGEYTIAYFLADLAGNPAQTIFRTITVIDTTIFAAPPIYTGVIAGEILNPPAQSTFGGAWYHKVESSKDKWWGIEGTLTLPEVKIRRYEGNYDTTLDFDPNGRNLDNPSVYMGGNATNESDVGLSFSSALINVEAGQLSRGSIAFRPFWRYITAEHKDEGGYDKHSGEYAVSCTGTNCIANYHWSYTQFYYLPGDKIRMIIHVVEPNWVQLQIEVIEKSTLPQSVEMREKYGWKDPENFKSPVFHSPGHGTGINAKYKRVNAIDQVANEGKTAIPSDTEILNGIWHETYLYRKIDGDMYRVPMNESRRSVMSAPDDSYYSVTFDGTKEVINIHPGYKNTSK